LIRETWGKLASENLRCIFFIGGDQSGNETDVMALPVNDQAGFLATKVQRFFQHALAQQSFDYLFKCEDDTFVAPQRVASLASIDDAFFSSTLSLGIAGGIHPGAGYRLSRKTVEILAECPPKMRESEAEWLLRNLTAAKIDIARSDCLLPDSRNWPQRENAIISSHWCSPAMTRAAFHGLSDLSESRPVLAFAAQHRSWQSRLLLFADGTFVGGAQSPNGTWQSSDDGASLKLHWFFWDAQELKRTSNGFADAQLCLVQDSSSS
jgi:hypothetical protein